MVTGAGRGIGRAAAERLAGQGMTVVGVSRTADDLRSLAEASGADFIAASVETADGCRAIVDEVLSRHGAIDILVHSAGGGSPEERAVWSQDPDMWSTTIAVNLDAAFHLTRLASAGMVERGFGRIVVVSSTAGQLGAPRMTAYCAAKHGVIGFVRAAAHDLAAHGVTCNAVCPGWVRTPASELAAVVEAAERGVTVERVWEERNAASPAGRVTTLEEVADTIAFLASPQASGVNGEDVRVSVGAQW
jgi:NAD(P)-dependent dehydrogenase (short-subunit alcohol dehydrogenase family)